MPSAFVDREFIEAFIAGTLNTLQVQCQLRAVPEKPYLKSESPTELLQLEIAGLVGITSEKFKGSISIGFPEKTFLGVMSKMLGETYTELTAEMEDGAGELMNIVFGAAKTALNEKGYGLAKALPSVVRGEGLRVRHLSTGPVIVMPFDTSVGKFQIEICMDAA